MARGIHGVLNGHYIISHSKCFVSVSSPFMRCLWVVDLWKPGDLFRSNVPYPSVTVNSWRLRAGKSEAVSSGSLTPASGGFRIREGLSPGNKLRNTKCNEPREVAWNLTLGTPGEEIMTPRTPASLSGGWMGPTRQRSAKSALHGRCHKIKIG